MTKSTYMYMYLITVHTCKHTITQFHAQLKNWNKHSKY